MNTSKFCVFGMALASAASVPAQSVTEFFTEGEFGFGMRARYEFADIDGASDSNAFTLKTNLSYKFAEQNGVGGFVDVADVSALDYGDYNAAGLNGVPGSVIADPETTEVKQAYLSYSASGATAKLGRQRIIYDGARHVGNVGWRQDEQTYDALSVSYKQDAITADYAYIWEVNRIFAEARDADSETHLFNGSYTVEGHKLSAFAYLYEFEEGLNLDAETYGVSAKGKIPVGDTSVGYYAEYAIQDNDAGEDTDYLHLTADVAVSGFTFGAGYELIGADSGTRFLTPLATAHKFNGWADTYLNNGGGEGLEDIYFFVKGKIAGKAPFMVAYHIFDSDDGSANEGDEIDANVAYKFNEHFTGLLKGAYYKGDTIADRTRFWAQIQFTY
ncbi:MAG: alginate export family protein [Opitutales bacterium]